MTIFLVRPDSLSLAASRGVESIDINISIILVKAPVEAVAQVLMQVKPWNVLTTNAYGQLVEQNQGTAVFRLQGHSWSHIYQPPANGLLLWLSESDALTVANLLSVDVIYYVASDTGGWFRYYFYQPGRLAEKLLFEYSDEGGDLQFESQFRNISERDIKDAYSFMVSFMREQDAYIPALILDRVTPDPIVGQQVPLQIENLAPGEIERMDYLYKTNIDQYQENANERLI